MVVVGLEFVTNWFLETEEFFFGEESPSTISLEQSNKDTTTYIPRWVSFHAMVGNPLGSAPQCSMDC
jgi:hypothetical protein